MKRQLKTLSLLAATAALSTAAFASSEPLLRFPDAVAYAESSLTSKVLHASVDPKHRHYHVDVRMVDGAVHALQIDPVTHDISPRETAPLRDPGMALPVSLSKAARYVLTQIPANMTLAEIDTEDTRDPHYHFDVLLDNGQVAQLLVSATTGRMDWRKPALR